MVSSRKPKVSVFVSTKNRASLITRAIDSILSQTFENFELIIADVSDNDLTAKVISQYNDSRIVYHKIDNEISPAKTINKFLFNAKGEYIALCDDDDEWCSKDKLKKQVALLDFLDEDYGFVTCGWELWNDKTNQHISFDMPKAKGNIFPLMLAKNVTLGLPTLLVKKSAYIAVGGFEESIKYSADYLLLTKLSKLYKFDFVPEIMVRGHQFHEYGSSSRLVKSKNDYFDKMEYFIFFLKFFESDYNAYPNAKKAILESIITMAVRAGNPPSCIKYMNIYLKGEHSYYFIFKRVLQFAYNILLIFFKRYILFFRHV